MQTLRLAAQQSEAQEKERSIRDFIMLGQAPGSQIQSPSGITSPPAADGSLRVDGSLRLDGASGSGGGSSAAGADNNNDNINAFSDFLPSSAPMSSPPMIISADTNKKLSPKAGTNGTDGTNGTNGTHGPTSGRSNINTENTNTNTDSSTAAQIFAPPPRSDSPAFSASHDPTSRSQSAPPVQGSPFHSPFSFPRAVSQDRLRLRRFAFERASSTGSLAAMLRFTNLDGSPDSGSPQRLSSPGSQSPEGIRSPGSALVSPGRDAGFGGSTNSRFYGMQGKSHGMYGQDLYGGGSSSLGMSGMFGSSSTSLGMSGIYEGIGAPKRFPSLFSAERPLLSHADVHVREKRKGAWRLSSTAKYEAKRMRALERRALERLAEKIRKGKEEYAKNFRYCRL
jgi:hypothetical protein